MKLRKALEKAKQDREAYHESKEVIKKPKIERQSRRAGISRYDITDQDKYLAETNAVRELRIDRRQRARLSPSVHN